MNEENDDELFPELMHDFEMELRPDFLIEQHPVTKGILVDSDRVTTASFFGAMQLDRHLQSNCIRLEVLVHLAVAYGDGDGIPKAADFVTCFNELGGGLCGRMEDPAEDVFVSLVTTSQGNFRVLQGIWECGAFYLQRVLDLVESLPDAGDFSLIREHVFCLLRLSEEVCRRAGLERYSVGTTSPLRTIKKKACADVRRKTVIFSRGELRELGVDPYSLDLFTFKDQLLSALRSSPIGNSPLQRFPILDTGDGLALILPTAVTHAIRAIVIDFLSFHGLRECLCHNLAMDYANLFRRTHLVGSFVNTPVRFSNNFDLPIAEAMIEADYGCYFHLLFFIDTLDSFDETGVAGLDPTPTTCIETFATRIHSAVAHAKKHPHFRRGVTLLVHCGFGRGTVMPLPVIDQVNWNVQFISAPDLITLSYTHKFDAMKLFKILDAERRLPTMRIEIEIENHNGLLNLIAWIDSNDGHFVPHSKLPKKFRRSSGVIIVAPSFVLGLRAKAATENDCQAVQTVDGNFETVRHYRDSLLLGGNDDPIYAVDEFSSRRGIPFVYLSRRRAWWCHVVPTQGRHPGAYDRWQMLKTWLARIVPIIEPRLDERLAAQVLLRVEFDPCDLSQVTVVPVPEEIEKSIAISNDVGKCTVSLVVGKEFDRGLCSPVNIAERQLVVAICRGFARLVNVEWSTADLTEIESQIVDSDDARHMHRIQTRAFRDYIHTDLSERVIRLDNHDVADLRMGLAFRVESLLKGRSQIRSKKQCTLFLNALIKNLEDDLSEDLRQFDRAFLIELALRNHEAAMLEREKWSRTARANIALHRDKTSIANAIAEHDAELSAVLFPSRVLIELALCECPLSGGRPAGQMEFSRLMAKLNAIYIFGGWSDSIHRDAMQPSLHITALGDVQTSVDFESNVLRPFAVKGSKDRIEISIDEYESNYQPAPVVSSHETGIEHEFEDAWEQEFGFAITDMRQFWDEIDDIGIECGKAVFRLRRSEMERLCNGECQIANFVRIVDAFSLQPRDSWRTVPDGFDPRDIQPWRFRRQLSAVRRPIIQLDNTGDPELLVAPGFIRESMAHILGNYYQGACHRPSCKSVAMQQWHDRRNKLRGSTFVRSVSKKVVELGWNIQKAEMQVKEILGISTDPDFGDIKRFGDVDVLAWSTTARRILVIECKNLHFHKTPGEVAEQLSDYRGRMKPDGTPDDLKKHLNRLEILRSRRLKLCKKIGVDDDFEIEGWIVFKNPVPMLYAWHDFEEQIRIATFDDLESFLSLDGRQQRL